MMVVVVVWACLILVRNGARGFTSHEQSRRRPTRVTTTTTRRSSSAVEAESGAATREARELLEAVKGTAGFGEAWDGEEALFMEGVFQGGYKFGFDELRAACELGQVAECGQGVVLAQAWQMKRVGPRDGGFVPWDSVAEVVQTAATAVFNSVDAYVPRVAELSLAALDAFQLPVCVNCYATGAGASVSAPAHTDKQRVLVIQLEGAKRWRVYRPPALKRGADPLARGKGADSLDSAIELKEPLLDVVLNVGDVLYIPAGFPHATETASCYEEQDDKGALRGSVHLTLGVDTHIWGLDGIGARSGCLRRSSSRDDDDLTENEEAYWALRRTLPGLGWRTAEDDEAASAQVVSAAALLPLRRELPPAVLSDVLRRLKGHASLLVAAQRSLYADVLLRGSGVKARRLANGKFYADLEAVQVDLEAWYDLNTKPCFSRGDPVQATIVGDVAFYDAVVEKEHPDGSVDIVFFDGEAEFRVDPSRVRRKQAGTDEKTPAKKKMGFAAASAGSNKKTKKKKKR